MIKWDELRKKISDDYTVYSSNMVKTMALPAVIFTPTNQVPDVELASFKNRILQYKFDLIVAVRLADYDSIEQAMDEVWKMSEDVPDLLGVKIVDSIPFGHYMGNEEIVCIELKVVSKI
jgi:hypothetical protein